MKRVVCLLIILLYIVPLCAFADLQIYCLDVGQADATIIVCDGDAMVIDGGTQSSSQILYSFIKNTLELNEIRYVVATHPHEDHIGGLPAVFNAAPVGLVLSPVAEWDSPRFQIMKRYAEAQAAEIYVPMDGDVFSLGKASFTIVHCWPEAWSVNDMSIALRLEYINVSFLFTGDAEQMAEYMMVDSSFSLESDVLHVSHHGSRSSSVPVFIRSVNPKYALISCSSDGGYGHPHQETLDTLKAQDVELYRTDLHGNITINSDGNSITFLTDHMTLFDVYEAPYFDTSQYRLNPDDEQETGKEVAYIGNSKTMKFHRLTCPSVISTKEKNRVPFFTREEAITVGYEPCGRCNP